MPTTTLVDSTFAAATLGARTDNAGVAVADTTAEEARLIVSMFNAGYVTPATSFVVAAQASPNMTVKVGSGIAKTDHYILSGTVAGQGNYIVRLDVASQNVTITAADVSQTRTDEIYLVVQDTAYDVSSRVLPRIGYRKGDLGGANPGPDTAWKASALLARVTVPAAATSITSGNISDQRVQGTLIPGVANTSSFVLKSVFAAKGDLLAGTGSGSLTRLGTSLDGRVLMGDTSQATGLKYAPIASVATNAVGNSETTTSVAYTNLATVGPSVTLTVGPTGIAIVSFSAAMGGSSAGSFSKLSYQVSGANSISPATTFAATVTDAPGDFFGSLNYVDVLYGLTPGSTTFTMKYAVSGGTGTFSNRDLKVVTF